MTDYFYFDQTNRKCGPIDEQQLRELATQGIIEPNTLLEEADSGCSYPAEQISELWLHLPTSKPLGASPELFDETPPGLFDLGFARFISNTWISIIWGISIVVHVFVALDATFYSIHANSPVLFLIALLAIPLSLLFCRMALELEVIFFRIESNTRETKEYLREIKEQLGSRK